jgi:hypothetical protein
MSVSCQLLQVCFADAAKARSMCQNVNAEIRTKTDRFGAHPRRFDPRESQRSIWRNQEDVACGDILCRRCAWVYLAQRW